MLGTLPGRLLGLSRRCPDDEAHATNVRTVEMGANPFLARTRARLAPQVPIFES